MGMIYSLLRSVSNEYEQNVGLTLDGTSASPKYSRKSNLKRQPPDEEKEFPQSERKKTVTFDKVTVYYFPRAQGFTSVPSYGGPTLGMASQHAYAQHFSILEHAAEKRRLHRPLLQLCSEGLNDQAAPEESGYGSVGEEEQSNSSESQLDLESHSLLTPVPPRQREKLLRAAGITEIDSVEKDECMNIRASRRLCGCTCIIYCYPDTCSCSQSGVECQVEYLNFPCGCSRYGCANANGRIQCNSDIVRCHSINTLMRLNSENKKHLKKEEEKGMETRTPRCSSNIW